MPRWIISRLCSVTTIWHSSLTFLHIDAATHWIGLYITHCLILKRVEDKPGLSYHKSLLCLMTITAPSKAKHTVTSQNTKAVSLPDFQADIKCFTDCYSQCPNRDLVDGYSAGLHAIMDCHTPLVTCCISHWCSAPWLTDEVREGPRWRQQAEHFWKSTHLTVYRKIFIREWATMKRCIWDARKLHYSSKIDVCCTTKLLFALMNCSAKQNTSLPLNIPVSDQPQCFCNFFMTEIKRICEDNDSCPCDPPTFSKFDRPQLSMFEPVSRADHFWVTSEKLHPWPQLWQSSVRLT